MKNLLHFVAGVLLAVSTSSVHAQEAATSKVKASDITAVPGSNDNPTGWVPFLGFGISAVEFDQGLTNRDGISGNARAIGSYYAETVPWVFDAGLGFDSADLDNSTINSGLLELAGRYRFSSSRKWHVGPVANLHFGDDVGVDYGSSEADVASFAGAQLIRDFALGERGILRAGVKAMTDVGIPDSTVNKFLFEMQIGLVGSQTVVKESHEVVAAAEEPAPLAVAEEVVEEKVEEAQTEIVQEAKAVEALVTTKNPQSLFFATGAKKIGPKNRAYISKLVELLKKHKDDIRTVQLTGYADPRGSQTVNETLAQARADEIARELQAAGLEGVQVQSVQGGILTADAVASDLRRARRVDVDVIGVENAELKAGLDAIVRSKQ